MPFLKFLIVLLFTIFFSFLLSIPLHLGTQALPPLGNLLNPYTGFWQNAEPLDQTTDLRIHTDQLFETVQVQFDERRVPHIFATELKDAYFAQGYVTARDRLFQMDLSTRSTSGRLSEIFGQRTINVDRRNRQRGLTYAAEKALKSWTNSAHDYELLLSYTAGINQYIASLQPKDYPLEFKLLNYSPEFWTPLKTALMVKSLALTLCAREQDVESTNSILALGKESFDFLFPEVMTNDDPVIPPSVNWEFSPTNLPQRDSLPIQARYGSLPDRVNPEATEFIGSNNWALAANKTASGFPILCNDPHLQLSLPSIWYEVQLHCPTTKAYGVTVPGIPGIAIGFNQNIAWGLTNVAHDVLDYYTIEWASDQKDQYLLDGFPKNVSYRIEKILVKDAPPIFDTIRYTEWGPVLTTEVTGYPKDMAMHWLAHETGPKEFAMFRGLNAARNYNDYVRSISMLHTPAQNIVFASKSGDIALTVQGRFPLKAPGQGRFIFDGSKRANSVKGFIPISHNPRVKNPARGFVSSANQRSTDTTYPYYYNGNFEEYRGRILNRKLEAMDKATIQDMMDLQNDNYSLKAEEAMPLMLAALTQKKWNKQQKANLEKLKNWDFNYEKNSIAPILFEFWFANFYQLCWDEIRELDSEQKPMRYPEHWRTIELMNTDPENSFFDLIQTPEKETAIQLLQQSFEIMCHKIEELQKENNGTLSWKTYKKDKIRHMARLDAFSSPILDAGGDKNVLNALRYGAGPSWRMIVELGDTIKAYGIYPGGQSGNPGSYFYDHMISDWSAGQYYELKFFESPQLKTEGIAYEITFSINSPDN